MGTPVHSHTVVGLLLVLLSSSMVVGESFAQGGEATFGFGTGSGTIMCSACTHSGNMGGSTLSLQVADAVRPHLRVGFTLDTWWHSREQWERGVWNVTAAMFYYPSAARRFFIQGGPTYSRMWATETDTSLVRHGWGFTAGFGYDIAPRSIVSFTPSLTYSYAWVGDIDYPLGTNIPFARGWKHEVVSLGLGVTLHERQR
jgi:hypothetical protein